MESLPSLVVLTACSSQPTATHRLPGVTPAATAPAAAAPAAAAPAATPPLPRPRRLPPSRGRQGRFGRLGNGLPVDRTLISAGYKPTTIKGEVFYCRKESVTEHRLQEERSA